MYIIIDGKLELCDNFSKTPEGYLLVEGLISRSGVQEYLAYELGIEDAEPLRIINIDRPTKEVTDPMSVASFLNNPIVDEHPITKTINSSNHGKLSKGIVTDAEPTESGHVKASMIIHDEELIKKIEAGKRELSAGYTSELEFSDDGKSATQTKIRGNHVAFVDAARCGKECSIFDSKPKEVNTMAKLKIQGVEYEVADSVVPAIQTLIKDNEKTVKKLDDVEEENSKTKAKLDAAEDKVKELEDEEEDEEEKKKKVQDAASKLTDAILIARKVINDFDHKGKSLTEIKKEVLADALPDLDLKEKDAVYIDTRFEILCEDLKSKNTLNDGLRTQMSDGDPGDMVARARNAKIERSQNAYKGGE